MLGKLDVVDIRDIWKREASDFTRWLSSDENLSALGEEIGISMSLVKTEAGVGSFSADILAEEANTGRKIIIENQLEQTDHDHFGKLFTYGSGYDASILIWICAEVREEHRQAIDWLNERTTNDLAVFVIKMEVWRIGDSLPAPKFQVICSPNDWAKTVKESASGKLGETSMLQLSFWTEFNTYLQAHRSRLKLRKPQPQHWYDVTIEGIPTTQAYLSLAVSFGRNFIRCEFYMPDNKDLYNRMYEHKAAIETELGYTLTWGENPKAKASSIGIRKENVKLRDRETWEESHKWLMETANAFSEVFAGHFKR